jgi:tetratricopeptide (TPR) repeat protein
MFTLVDLSIGQSMSALAELVGRRVLRDGATGLEFVNEMVRAAAYIGVPLSLRRVLHSKIADRLMLDDRTKEDLGLEIAWHCMRAGRTLEATPHLLRGAREAIRAGVPFGAERGLATAIGGLAGSSRTEALLLLAESLQEQSRWEESLGYLDLIQADDDVKLINLRFILRIKAQRRLGSLDLNELERLPAALLAFISTAKDRRSRISAAVEAASILDIRQSCDLAFPILTSIADIDENGLSVDDLAHLLLAKSMLMYAVRDFDSSMNYIQEAIAMLSGCKASNSVLAMLQIGIGAIYAKQGDYASSAAAHLQAYETATRIGNDHLYLQASANLALAYTRLGDYENASFWADQAVAGHELDIPFTFQLTAIRNGIIASAMLGRITNAEMLLSKGNERFANQKGGGVSQAWTLYAADALALLGRDEDAQAIGMLGTSGVNYRLHSDFYAGPYARWIAKCSFATGEIASGLERLTDQLRSLKNYDAIDQAEILNAKVWLYARIGESVADHLSEMNSRLEKFPVAVRDQLRRMGMLDFMEYMTTS